MTVERLLHVLVVDDENSVRLSIEMGLRMTNSFAVESCDSGEDAVELLKKETFDVIILDNRMPGMSGMDVLQWMHEQKVIIPVIMVTGTGSEEVVVEALKHGVYDFIRKDQISKDRLAIAIKSVHERFLYRKSMVAREAEERLLKEKQKELDSLQMFHNTVNSLGQLVEKNVSTLLSNLKKKEELLLKMVSTGDREQCQAAIKELSQEVELVASGVNSMRNLSTVVIQKLDEIKIAPRS
jgi:DNA-binding NtrC family response regulator